MRRLEFFSQEVSEFNHITNTGHIGYLGVMDENDYPRIIPLNFVSIGGDIYFHGACEGEKYELMKKNPKSTFSVDLPYAFIPSYWQSIKSAVPTTYFFKSLHIRGVGSIVDYLDKKVEVLSGMMQKYQPEGGFSSITTSEPFYKKTTNRRWHLQS